ncbi:MAG TPA: hypothetical protein VFI65_03600 [Streptosporangiaceae bacterium]|nr:hypothetical protein [Streptosporangiaceae bacterium]
MTRLRRQPTGRYPGSRRVVTENPDGTGQIEEPRSGRSWALNRNALFTVRQFDGFHTYDDIAAAVQERFGQEPNLEGLIAFEDRSLSLGLLEPTTGSQRRPGAGLARVARTIALPTLLACHPAALIDRLWPYLRWLTSAAAVRGYLLLVIGLGAVVLTRGDELIRELTTLLPHAGLIVLYCVAFASAALHEGAHVLACRRFEVPVNLVAFGVIGLLPVAWTVPDQRAWSNLRLRHRLITAGAGPLATLVSAAFGALLWLAGHQVEVVRITGLLIMSTGPAVMLPTLIPTFPGDAYLVLTELTGRPGLRQLSLRHLTAALGQNRPRPAVPVPDKAWYLGFGIATIASWIGGLSFMCWLIWHSRHLAII